MSFCQYAEGDAMLGSTSVANIFIMEYLPSAPPEYVKVYLYGLLLCRHPEICDGFEKMGEVLHLDIGTVKNAMNYWEREGAVQRLSENPPSYAFIALAPSSDSDEEDDEDIYSNRAYIKTLQSLLPSLMLENHELGMANDWLDVFHLQTDAVYYMIQLETEKRGGHLPSAKTLFKHLNETAIKWAENGVTDEKSAREFMARDGKYNAVALAVIDRFNQKRAASVDETNLVEKWMNEWGYTREDILEACGETTKGERPSFGYVDKVLENRRSNPDEGLREKVKQLNRHLGISNVPTQAQSESLKSFLGMGFEFEAIEQAAIQCGELNRRQYSDIEKKLNQWKKAGVFTVQEIEEERRQRKHYSDIMYKVFETAGIERRVSEADLATIRIWTALMEPEAVLLAAESARGTENPIKYIDKIIKNWSAQGVNTLEKAKAASQNHSTAANTNKVLSEREVNETEFEKDFYADIMNRKRAGE